LFDTGAKGKVFFENMKKLAIEPKSVDEVFVSHLHNDHIGGLNDFLNINSKVKVYTPSSLNLKNEVVLKTPKKIHPNIFSTGELDNIEQSLGIITKKGVFLIVGCCHPAMENILNAGKQFGKIYEIVGSLHGFFRFKLFKDLKLICPAHCTQHKKELKKLYPSRCIKGGAGKTIEV
jgi:7,8-dihydropterin-6-yl-methyl-4-(beta-D-ribofuranosyl)aminobenzene 5'-phosphate synthase